MFASTSPGRGLVALAAGLAAVPPVAAIPWIVTEYYQASVSTIDPQTVIGDVTFSADVFTETQQISVTKSPIPSPITAATSVNTNEDLTIVSQLLPAPAAGPTFDPFAQDPYINYFIALTYSAQPTCKPGWTFTTSAQVVVPPEVEPTPIATLPPSSDLPQGRNLLIAANDLPSSSLTSLSSAYAPYWTNQCTTPVTGANGYPTYTGAAYTAGQDCVSMELLFGGSAVGGGLDCDDGMHWLWGLSLAGLICAWIFSFVGFFLLAGLLENWFTFRSLCRGHAARRGLPICWAFMFPFLSCFFLIGSNRGFVAKPVDEQQVLQRRWDDLGGGTKLGQWFKWGFRWAYPPFLGPTPPQKGAMLHHHQQQPGSQAPPQYVQYHAPPQMTQQGPPMEQPYPPQPYAATSPVTSTMSPHGASPPPTHSSPYASPPPQQFSPYGAPPPPQGYVSPTSPTAPYGQYGHNIPDLK